MHLLISDKSNIRGAAESISNYIRSCYIYPNRRMIKEATCMPEYMIGFPLTLLENQERMYVMFRQQDKGYTDVLIHYLMEDRGDDIASFREANRYYDEDGIIHYRFTEEEVAHSIAQYQNH